MSHFTVAVIVDHADTVAEAVAQAEHALEPFDENLETDERIELVPDQEVKSILDFYADFNAQKRVQELAKKAAERTSSTEAVDQAVAKAMEMLGQNSPTDAKMWERVEAIFKANVDTFIDGVEKFVAQNQEEVATEAPLPAADSTDPADRERIAALVGDYYAGSEDRGIFDGEHYGYRTTYNENAQWDWYQVGGRWRGFFLTKPDASEYRVGEPGVFDEGSPAADRADVVRVGDIDFDQMRAEARKRAEEAFDEFEAATEGLEVAKSFEQCREEHGDDIDAARTAFHSQPWVKAVRSLDSTPFLGDMHAYWKVGAEDQREAFVKDAEAASISTWAVLLDDQWTERGSMGWFGLSDEKVDESEWHQRVADLYAGLDPNTWVVLVDCHI